MANKRFWLGMLVMVLVFGMTVVGCDDGSTNNGNDNGTLKDVLDGTTWKGSLVDGGETVNLILTFNSPNYTIFGTKGRETGTQSGTYSISGNRVTFTDNYGSGTGTLSGNNLYVHEDGGVLFTKQ